MSGSQRACGWISSLWLAAAVGLVGSHMDLQTPSEVLSSCGGNATLTCVATSLSADDITDFTWVDGKRRLCQYGNDSVAPELLCESTAEPSQHRLTLTLINVMPVLMGEYLCKLQSKLGTGKNSTALTLQGCLGGSNSSVNGSHAQCNFTGVYPGGTVHWRQGDDNLTDGAVTWEETDPQGRFNILSSVALETGNKSQNYTCELWIPAQSVYMSSVEEIRSAEDNGGAAHTLLWICLLVEVMTFACVA